MRTTLFLFCLLSFSSPAFAQSKQAENTYHEAPDDPYIPVERADYATSPAYRFSGPQIVTNQVNVNAAGENMLDDAANEPSIAVDPTNPMRMAIGWRQFDTVISNFRQAGYAYTLDGGETWTFPGPIEPGVFRSDPVLDFDALGRFYYNSLQQNFSCQVFRSDGDIFWDGGTPAQGGDKQWMAIDRTAGATAGNIYASWNPNFAACTGAFTRSLDDGDSYESCTILPGNMTRGTLAVGPSGELYACGFNGSNFYVARASNPGVPGQNVVWDFVIPMNLGGSLAAYNGPNPSGLLGQSWIAVDHSGGPTHGYVYLLATVFSSATGDLANIMFSRSTNGGGTWSAPVKINDDPEPTNWNWFGTLSVAPNGRIDVAWVDTRDQPGTYLSSLYFSHSEDGGETWSPDEKLSEYFDPHLGFPNQTKIGDYYHMVSDNAGAHLAWAATFNGEEDIYYSHITVDAMTALENPVETAATVTLFQNSPNPFSDFTRIGYETRLDGEITLEIFDVLGKKVKTLKKGHQPGGRYYQVWDGETDHGTQADNGVYVYRLSVGHQAPVSGKLLKLE